MQLAKLGFGLGGIGAATLPSFLILGKEADYLLGFLFQLGFAYEYVFQLRLQSRGLVGDPVPLGSKGLAESIVAGDFVVQLAGAADQVHDAALLVFQVCGKADRLLPGSIMLFLYLAQAQLALLFLLPVL